MNTIRKSLRFSSLLLIFIGFFGISHFVFADGPTIVPDEIDTNTTWTKEDSPYLIGSNGAWVPPGITLTIEPGAIIKAVGKLYISGMLHVEGTNTEKVYFTSWFDDTLGGDTDDPEYDEDGNEINTIPNRETGEYLGGGIFIGSDDGHASAILDNVDIKYASAGLVIHKDDDVSINNSIFEDNSQAIGIDWYPVVHISRTIIKNNDNGISIGQHKNSPNATVVVSDSSISGNIYSGVQTYFIQDQTRGDDTRKFAWFFNLFKPNKAIAQEANYAVDFRNVWWGDSSGPHNDALNSAGLGDTIIVNDPEAPILFDPWLTSDPFAQSTCCSNVLFLPGIQSSVLETGNDTLWPPTTSFSNDIPQLALDNNGNSINDVHVNGILNTFYGTPIYGPFSDFMDGISGDSDTKLINEWLPLGYDWRFSPEKILTDGIKTKDGTIDVIQKIEDLAVNSRTGKVTIIAHSMGGLLGKAIIKQLQDEGKDDLIDSFVMAAVPQLGTPQAVGALLHGDQENILGGFIANAIDMRSVAQNMQSAYNLLPSSEYFNKVSDPIITFNSNSSFTSTWRSFWGPTINTYASFQQFITGQGVPRSEPDPLTLRIPEVLKSDLVAGAENLHNQYDDYQFPDHIRVVQIAGWGVPTVKSINYKNVHLLQGYDDEFTREGDSTVVYPSAVSASVDETYYFNLNLYKNPNNKSFQHRDLLNTQPLQDLLSSVVQEATISTSNFVSSTKPQVVNLDDEIIISTHSPVILGAYDQLGNFTGVEPNQDLSADVLSIKEDIPGSTFLYTGGSQEIFLPKGGSYNFTYTGTGNGPTTVHIGKISADNETPVAMYSDIPTTDATNATFVVDSSVPESTLLNVDTDGDGQTDNIIVPDGTQQLSLDQLIVSLQSSIQSLNIKDKVKQNLLKEVTNLQKKIQNKKEKNAKIIANLQKSISNKEMKGKISTADANSITDLLTQLEASSENIVLDPAILAVLKAQIQSLNIKQNQKEALLKRVAKLENEQGLIQTLSNMTTSLTKKNQNGKIQDSDTQALLDLLNKIEGVI